MYVFFLPFRNSEKPLPADSAYFTTSESKAKFLTRYNEDIMQEKNKACVDEEASLAKKKVKNLAVNIYSCY